MHKDKLTLAQLLERMRTENPAITAASELPAPLQQRLLQFEEQPWFIKALVGFGAWLGSWLFIAFALGVSLMASDGGYVVLGLMFIVGATVLSRLVDHLFINQVALATSMAGQLMLGFGLEEMDLVDDVEGILATLIMLNLALIPLFRDRAHRFLSVLFICSATAILLYIHKQQALIPFIPPLLAAGFVWLTLNDSQSGLRRFEALTSPLAAGMIVAALGWSLLSAVYVLPDLLDDFVFYPNPWISTLGIAAVLIWSIWRTLFPVFGEDRRAPAILIATVLLTAVTAYNAPGLMVASLALVVGVAQRRTFYIGLGVVFLSVFLTAYFYGIEISLLAKSISLVATGAVLIGVRKLLDRIGVEEEAKS
ncbi:DUF4401 domain-containing protein [Hahella sp. KA22]|uniref:DUF4401 domain-containing protein n=1 Tax=Hahella sp. KA22 TaxID=1628392 RepID=UPI000FDD6B72|nr:DUF4401 domain-containing protein [Hahella sp. KA22]AZZ90312.1 DUF4401 domain-containing protein [Hahella sp. KA22]QAY53683.1 DUF4401 domain-containing protein [Hahella sp. KA22]